jgi:GT2 family glycosyltransferase
MIISILIPVYNRIEVTKYGLKQLNLILNKHKLSNNITVDYKIIVIDDVSSDKTSEWISSNFSNIVILKGDGNLWWSGAINYGVKYSIKEFQSDYLLLWNNDIIPTNNFFEKLETKILTKNNSCIIGSLILDCNSGKIWANGGYFNSLTGKRSVSKLRHKSNKTMHDVDWLPGMGTLIPSKVISDIGYWDEDNFPQYHGDIDYCLRAKRKGIKIKVCEEMVIKNKTEYSSFIANDLRGFFKSLVMIQSRYNISKEIKFLFRHTKSPLWVYYFTRKYLGYIFLLIRK